jgi:hypothetical protein
LKVGRRDRDSFVGPPRLSGRTKSTDRGPARVAKDASSVDRLGGAPVQMIIWPVFMPDPAPYPSRPSIFGVLTVAVLTFTVLGTPAHAEKQDARKHYDKATAAFGLGNFADAANEYEAAFRLRPDPALLYNCAQSYRLAGNKVRAAELYRNYLRLYGEASNAEDARRHLSDLELELAAERAAQTRPGVPAEPPSPTDATSGPVPAVPSVTSLAPPPAVPPSLAEAPRPATEGHDDTRPLYRRSWFWIAVGAAVVGGTVAILVATKRDGDPTATFGSFPAN